MARWIYNRQAKDCPESEVKVARRLNRLPDNWTVRWGYFYDGDREGDFLVLGPNGLLVLEAKGGNLRRFSGTGRREDVSEDPLEQLFEEWKAVLAELRSDADGVPLPFVCKVLGLPDVPIPDDVEKYEGIPRELILDSRDLEDFEHVWNSRLFWNKRGVTEDQRQLFLRHWGEQADPRMARRFIDETDRLLLRHAKEEYSILEMLSENRQLLVAGGPGTGKTWIALEKAFQLAEEGTGRDVLLLCYNLALGRLLAQLAEWKKPKRGRIVVRAWEDLAKELYGQAGIEWSPPTGFTEMKTYYEQEVPWILEEVTSESGFKPLYDALVVDEAQDHDTEFQNTANGSESLGWWDAYFRLLRRGTDAQIIAVYDPAQRPHFRIPDAFDPRKLLASLSQPAHVRLPHVLRYSGPMYRFLKTLESDGTRSLLESFDHRGPLHEGPEVEMYASESASTPGVVREIVLRWIAQGLCRTDEILIISRRKDLSATSLANVGSIGEWPLVPQERWEPGTIPYISINKAKGLDSLAVIMIDMPEFKTLAETPDQVDYFMGASRARQLLAVVQNDCPSPTTARSS